MSCSSLRTMATAMCDRAAECFAELALLVLRVGLTLSQRRVVDLGCRREKQEHQAG